MSNKRVQLVTEPEQINHTLDLLKADSHIDIEFAFFSNERLKGRVVGSQSGKYFLLALPKTAFTAHETMLAEGQSVVVRAIIEGDTGACVAFKVRIQSVSRVPYYLLFVDYPSKLELFHLRQQARLATQLPASISLQKASSDQYTQVLTGTLHDISVSGCRFKANSPARVLNHLDRMITLDIGLDTQAAPLKIKAKVTNSNAARNGVLSLGIEFIAEQMSQEDKHLIAQFVQYQLLPKAG
ncbi:PilZ domain-containing protein [Shewanella waksmanii]|uniref:PilZ domain-containing protein n=1 Tax=Shewanella waksmanii TaxID=213783 RepID=UPI00048E5830|nr:flagellar brake protein [Shewanella waksmanii]